MDDKITRGARSPAPLRVPLTGHGGVIRGWAVIDAADRSFVEGLRWHLAPSGYAKRNETLPDGSQRNVLMHRMLLGLARHDGLEVDHINRVRADNRRANLRVTDRFVNNGNRVWGEPIPPAETLAGFESWEVVAPPSRVAPTPKGGPTYGLPLRNRAGEVLAWTIVSPEDYEWASQFNWSLNSHGRPRRRTSENKVVFLHRAVTGAALSSEHVDHIDGDLLNNRRENLRICTAAENHQNRHKARRGVTFDKSRDKWKAQVTLNYRNHFLGRFDTEKQAAQAAAAFRAEHMPFSADARN